MAIIALKIDVDTLRGTREGVPTLLGLLEQARARATFLFSLGPDHTGWALKRVFRPGFLQKVSRTSVVEHYGIKTLLYGTLLPGPDIGRRAAAEMHATQATGHEIGIHTWDHVYWQDNVRQRDAAWTERQMSRAYQRFGDIFGEAPATHGAAGWQMNDFAFAQLDAWRLRYASDGRGTHPHFPIVGGKRLSHVQLPTTLPTLDELLGVDGRDAAAVAADILARTENSMQNHVFTLHAELEGQKLAPIFSELLAGWQRQGHQLVSMGDYYATLDIHSLPACPVVWGEIPGRAGELILQGAAAQA
ncbi:MAG: 4-deoxy-4-formamido-L-arabinose-phosphoundecaprenol deformylase [Burkholderiales bacterium]|nr:4-deoxy-4-formamido-L-arabinose-phosphoundecaprenol deformylase [Burkholderiales bacterium]MDE2610874.1 4-deoxy-4-formamido-L-arabinose-phosphoundecaprenol deformylase [Burkholderiales bacterium]